MVKGGLDISQFFKCNSTSLKNILHIICGQAGDINALKYFVQSYDCFLMPKDRNGWTPLHYACNYGHLDIVMYLMNELNCESQTESTKGEMPLVHVACSPCCSEEKALSVLNFLIVACKCDQNARDIDGNSPLMYLLHNRPSMKCIARYLIVECQCDLSIKNHDEDNAFHIACKTCNVDVVQILLETRSNEINAKNKEKNTPLHLACKFGHEEVVKMLLSSQNCCLYELNEASLTPLQVAETNNHLSIVSLLIYAMYDNPDDNRNTPLHIACQDKNIHLVKIILERNFNVTAANSNGDTPLHLACRSGSFKVVKLLIDDCDVDSRNKNGNTPLHEACSVGHIAIAKLLLKSSMFPDAKNYTGLTPTQCAFQHNNFKIAEILITWPGNGKLRGRKLTMEAILTKVKHLVKEGVEPLQILNIKFDKEVKTFLHAACTVGDIEAVQLLTTNSIHNHESDINGWTPLHYACYYGHYEIVHYLIEEVQSNPYITTKNGINPLQLACDSQCLKVVTYLATEGRCNPDAIVYNRDALLSYLLKSARCPLSILQYLITGYHCKLSIQDIDGNTALHIACSKVSNLDAVNMIVSRSDWPNHVRNHEGNTPLHLACMFGYSEIVKTLLETRKCGLYELNKAQCTPLEVTSNTETALLLIKEMYLCRDKDGNTPLHTACQNQNPQQIMFITKNGFDVSTRNYDNDTPLHLLCRNGNYHCTKILINSNNDLNVRNKNGDTPLSLACRHCHYHIVKMLLTTEGISNKDSNGDTPLHLACQTNSVTLVKLVLEKCSTFHIKEQNNSGNTSLHLAYKFDNARMAHLLIKTLVIKHHQGLIYSDITQENLLMEVKQLVKEGVDPSYLTWMQVDEIKKQSFLHAACGHIGDTEAVQLLAGKGNSDIKDAQGWTPLHYACIHGHLEIMTHLITQAKSNPEIATPAGTLPLQLACSHSICSEAKALNIVKFLITTAKCDPDTNVYDGDTLLIYLLKTKNKKISILQYLILDYGCCLSTRDYKGNTALHIVCSYVSSNLQFQALKVIKMIADKGDCYANVKNDLFDTPLRLACMGGKLQIINALLSSFGGNCGLYDEDNIDHIPLITAFNLGNHSIASLIITEMYKRQDKSRNTPLHIACMTGNISLMQFIAKMNCDINAMNHDGDTALHIAVRKGHLELMKVLLELVSDTDVIHQCNKVGKNPLHVACEIGDPLLFVELLKWKSFSLAKHEYTLLHLACECGHTPIVDIMLLETDVDINAKNSDGCTALHVACETGNNKIALLLLGKECDINIRDKNGNTPLHLACQAGSFQVCEEMLKANCNINARNNDGDTPLFMACKYCHFDILQQLINETEIQINATNNAGDTLFHILCRSPYCTSTITRYALEITQIDPNMPN